MKNLFTAFMVLLFTITITAQEKKVEIVSNLNISDNDLLDSLQGVYLCFGRRVTNQNSSFKVHTISSENENWVTQQDVYNSIRAKVPGVRISNTGLNQVPIISMRGDSNTIVILDGVRVNSSILNTLNPNDIANIHVSNSPVARNFLQYNR